MAQYDLLTKKTVLNLIENLFAKYLIDYKPGGDIETFGFNAELPQAIEALPSEFDVASVIKDIEDGQSLNIPHQGYCINKDLVIRMITDAARNIGTSEVKSVGYLDELDKAIQFLSLQSFCVEDCWGKNCMNCNRFKAKKNAMIALNYFRQVEAMRAYIHKLKAEATSEEQKECYSNIEDMLQIAWDYAHDRKNIS